MVINSLLDNDLYKLTMMHAVREKYPEAEVTYSFINRDASHVFTLEFLSLLKQRLRELELLKLKESEYAWLKKQKILPKSFLDFLKSFTLPSGAIQCRLNEEGQLELTISGLWCETILFEVPILALISQTHYEVVEKNWDGNLTYYAQKTFEKGQRLSEVGCHFSDFGTRRRRSYQIHKTAIDAFCKLPENSTFVGSSNMHFAQMFDIKPIGTLAHEWIMGHGGMFGVQGANRRAFEVWDDVFKGKFAIALTDTYSSELFFKEFTPALAKKYTGLRHDSGDPMVFTDRALDFYNNLGIKPKGKTIVYSDSLDTEKAIAIERYVKNRINPVYGIGTYFTNDFNHVKALNMVIKLTEINGTLVAKTTDSSTKASGADKTIKQTQRLVKNFSS